ncbi:hypothetical protein ACA874_001228 [Vibrio vulnificus]|uniref:hypothetical protein n=1 Tax=Vibrio vulnificus TaxID=672 RepID=UPI003241CF32
MSEVISSISDIIVGLSALGTFGIACYGVTNWKRELKGKNNFEISKNLMKSVYNYRDAIQSSRSMIILGSSQYLEELDNNKEQKLEVWKKLFDKRWKPVRESVQELSSLSLETEVLLGKEVKKLIVALKDIALDLRHAMDAVIDYQNDAKPEVLDFYKKHPDVWKNIEFKVVKDPYEKDNMSIEIKDTINKLESILISHLKRN